MKKTRAKIVILFVLPAVLAGIAYVWSSMAENRRWEKGYSQIAAGDSKQKVVEILGKPTEIKSCDDVRYSAPREIAEKCVEEYWYIAFMQEWGYDIDKDGRVLTKWHSVSP